MSKKQIIKDYNLLPKDILDKIKDRFPYGYQKELIIYKTPKGEMVSALPFDTEDVYYLIKMPKKSAAPETEDDVEIEEAVADEAAIIDEGYDFIEPMESEED